MMFSYSLGEKSEIFFINRCREPKQPDASERHYPPISGKHAPAPHRNLLLDEAVHDFLQKHQQLNHPQLAKVLFNELEGVQPSYTGLAGTCSYALALLDTAYSCFSDTNTLSKTLPYHNTSASANTFSGQCSGNSLEYHTDFLSVQHLV